VQSEKDERETENIENTEGIEDEKAEENENEKSEDEKKDEGTENEISTENEMIGTEIYRVDLSIVFCALHAQPDLHFLHGGQSCPIRYHGPFPGRFDSTQKSITLQSCCFARPVETRSQSKKSERHARFREEKRLCDP
jgi:hypothetical protein